MTKPPFCDPADTFRSETTLPLGGEHNMWSSVGSAGMVNTADISKVTFLGSVAQLGVIGNIGTEPIETAHKLERRPIRPTQTATIRYPVQEPDLGDQRPGVWDMTVRYRDGDGQITISLMQVNLATGTESLLVTLESGDGYNRSNNFHDEISQGTFGLTFSENVYYVVVTMTGPAEFISVPPAIQLMQIGPA